MGGQQRKVEFPVGVEAELLHSFVTSALDDDVDRSTPEAAPADMQWFREMVGGPVVKCPRAAE
jgi:hypothetical protein